MERINIGEAVIPAQPPRARPGIGRAARFLSATLLCVAPLSAPDLAYAAHGGGGGGGGFGGGFHGGGLGGGFHATGSGGFRGGAPGGFHAGALGEIHAATPGGFHAGEPGRFHNGGFSGGGFHVISPGAGMDRSHAGEFRGGSHSDSIVLRGGERAGHGGERAGHWSHGWHNGSYGWYWGYDPYLWSSDGLYDDYSGDGQAYAAQSWYYCSDPAGYYPYIAQCNTSWQAVPAQ